MNRTTGAGYRYNGRHRASLGELAQYDEVWALPDFGKQLLQYEIILYSILTLVTICRFAPRFLVKGTAAQKLWTLNSSADEYNATNFGLIPGVDPDCEASLQLASEHLKAVIRSWQTLPLPLQLHLKTPRTMFSLTIWYM